MNGIWKECGSIRGMCKNLPYSLQIQPVWLMLPHDKKTFWEIFLVSLEVIPETMLTCAYLVSFLTTIKTTSVDLRTHINVISRWNSILSFSLKWFWEMILRGQRSTNLCLDFVSFRSAVFPCFQFLREIDSLYIIFLWFDGTCVTKCVCFAKPLLPLSRDRLNWEKIVLYRISWNVL